MPAGKKARDLRNWLTIYSYWNQGGLENVTSMLLYLVDNYSRPTGIAPSALLETPDTGKLTFKPSVNCLYSTSYYKMFQRSCRRYPR